MGMIMRAARALDADDHYVTLGIDDEVFAVQVRLVEEILDYRPVTLVPNAPVFMRGMIDVRGRTVPVIDLRARLGLPPRAPTPHTRIVVLRCGMGVRSLALGLVADRVFEVTGLDGDVLEPPPDIGIRWRSDYIQGVGRRNQSFVVVLDLERLLSSEEVALVADAPATEG